MADPLDPFSKRDKLPRGDQPVSSQRKGSSGTKSGATVQHKTFVAGASTSTDSQISTRGAHTRSQGLCVAAGESPPYRRTVVKKISEEEIKALTDSFENLAHTLTEAPASGPLIKVTKFDPAALSAKEWLREFEEACALSNWNDPTIHARLPFYLASGAARHWHTLNKNSPGDYTTLKNAFLREFVPKDEMWLDSEKLRSRKFRVQDEYLVAFFGR